MENVVFNEKFKSVKENLFNFIYSFSLNIDNEIDDLEIETTTFVDSKNDLVGSLRGYIYYKDFTIRIMATYSFELDTIMLTIEYPSSKKEYFFEVKDIEEYLNHVFKESFK